MWLNFLRLVIAKVCAFRGIGAGGHVPKESATRMMRLILLRTAASAGEEPPPSEPIGQGSAETFVLAPSEPLDDLVKKTGNDQKS